ncbi:hypothetical protein [Micavibrio aeruginosavorus]|nr:hypothetical protein [Micavibrio aeruginosavorus]
MDPLAVLMSKVSVSSPKETLVQKHLDRLLYDLKALGNSRVDLPWIDDDVETLEFTKFWFAQKQRKKLRAIAFILNEYRHSNMNKESINLLELALSRIIITKKIGASLAWDISHSRPHRAKDTNDFDVVSGYTKSALKLIENLCSDCDFSGTAVIKSGDARKMTGIDTASIDAIVTSPPYLNAIDYLRGHKLALVWLGHDIEKLRQIRASSIGTEKTKNGATHTIAEDIQRKVIPQKNDLQPNQIKMINRYIVDAINLMGETSRVLKENGKAIFVIGNSCLRSTHVENSEIFKEAARIHNLKVKHHTERELPQSSRYLPIPKGTKEALGKRMRSEHVLTFVHKN